MVLDENTGLQAPINPPNNKSNPKNSRLAKVTFILGLIGIVLLALSFVAPALIIPARRSMDNYFILMAIVGITALLGLLLALVSIIMGIISLIMIRKSKGMLRGKGWAISGLLMGLIPLLLIGGLIIYGFVMAASASRSYSAKPFDPSQYKGATGSIVLPYKGESVLTLYGKGESIRLTTADGTIKTPVGDYTVSSYEASGQDEKNTKWTASSYPRSSRVVVKDGTPAHLAIGPPFMASVDVKSGPGNQVSMTFNLKDNAGNSFTIYNSEPSFQVISQSGDTLWQGKFQFG
ncbi:MAG: hypothetical protein HZA49_00565 [Planctomycetes bacterium]|nr:hypothetical protein [Planctomycetota bacterium]